MMSSFLGEGEGEEEGGGEGGEEIWIEEGIEIVGGI